MLLAMAFPGAQNVPINAAPSPLVIGFAFALSLVTGILFGVAPAWIAAQAQPAEALRSGTRTTATGASLLQRGLVVLQASLSLVLLVGAGLFAQSLNKLESSDLHLDSKNRYIIHINPQAAGYSQTQVEPLYRTIEDQFHGIPGVVKVGIATYTPMEDNNWGNSIQIQGQPDLNKGASWVKGNAEYFDSVGTHVLMGRGFTPHDLLAAPPVAVVNKEFVKQFFKPGENPIGHRMGSPGPQSPGDYEIVGVVDDTTYTAVQWKDHAMYFVPITQRPVSAKDPDHRRHLALCRRPRHPDRSPDERHGEACPAHALRHQSQPHHREVPDLRSADCRPLQRRPDDRALYLALRRHLLFCWLPSDSTASLRTRSFAARRRSASAWPSAPNASRVIGMVMRGAMTAGGHRSRHRRAHRHALRPLHQSPALRNHQC